MERMMKVQEVLLRAMAKKITWWQAAEIIGVSARTMRRWRERLEQDGYDELADRRKGMVSPKPCRASACRPQASRPGQTLQLVREATKQFADVNAATAAGYQPFLGCVSDPDHGAMG